jgi:hypothetical protein
MNDATWRYVWLVHYDNYGDTWLAGAFDSEEKAWAYVDGNDPQWRYKDEWQRDYRVDKTRLQ